MFRAEDFAPMHGKLSGWFQQAAELANDIHAERCPQHSESQAKRMAVQFKDAYEKVKAERDGLRDLLESAAESFDTLSVKGFHDTPEFIALECAKEIRAALEKCK